MTLVEVIVVMVVVFILLMVVSFSYKYAIGKGLKLQCAQNLRVIWNALLIYVEDHQVGIPPGSDANMIYGAMNYPGSESREGGLTNLRVYVCPATSHKPPESDGYGNKLLVTGTSSDYENPSFTGSSIDYWIVKKQIAKGSTDGANFALPSIPDTPEQNVLIIEASDIGLPFQNHTGGLNLVYKSGKVQFINSLNPEDYPVNLWDDGTLEEEGPGDPLTVVEVERTAYAVKYP